MNKITLKYFLSFSIAIAVAGCYNKKNNYGIDGRNSVETNSTSNDNENYASVDNKNLTLTATEFIKWCADAGNHLNKTKELSEFKYNLMYMPVQSMAYLELRTEDYDVAKFEKACDHYSEMTYFNLKIEVPNSSGELLKYQLSSPQQYENRIKHISFNMQNDIFLIQNGDTLNPGLYQFERIFEVAPYATVMMGFDNKKFKREKEFTIVFEDKLFDKGFIKFNYKNGQLINVPTIVGL